MHLLQENRVTQRDLRSHSNHKLRCWWSSVQAASCEISAELVCRYFKASDARESNKTWFLLHKIHRAIGGRRSWKRQVHRLLDDGLLSTRKANEERTSNDPTEGARWWKCEICWKITAVKVKEMERNKTNITLTAPIFIIPRTPPSQQHQNRNLNASRNKPRNTFSRRPKRIFFEEGEWRKGNDNNSRTSS